MKKNKVLINVSDINEYNEYKKIGYNNFLFAVQDFSIGYKTFKLDEIKDLNCKKYVLVNRILDNEDIEKFKSIIKELESVDGVFFEDIGVYNLLKDTNIKLIWNQGHFATNYKSINYWLEYVYSAVISNELTKEEVKDIIDNSNSNIILNVFGKNPIMYSRRTLLTNFNNYYNLKMRNNAILKDKISNNEYKILESEKGSIIFNNEYFSIINYLKYFDDNKILYYLIYPDGLKVSDVEDLVNETSTINYNSGFMDKKTIYKLGDKK